MIKRKMVKRFKSVKMIEKCTEHFKVIIRIKKKIVKTLASVTNQEVGKRKIKRSILYWNKLKY